MKKLLIALAIGLVALALAVPALAAPPPTTSTTTTTAPPVPESPTRGVIACPQGTGPWGEWIEMGDASQVFAQASLATGAGSFPLLEIGFSPDGTDPLPEGNGSSIGFQTINDVKSINTIWPFIRFRCINSPSNTPYIAWRIA